jgi:hypothetical protein
MSSHAEEEKACNNHCYKSVGNLVNAFRNTVFLFTFLWLHARSWTSAKRYRVDS